MMGNGVLNPNYVDDCNSPRPAPTLNPSSLLFSSQAVGGKATEVGKTLSENSTSGHEWKLTVLDSNRKLKIDFGSIERIGNEIYLLFSEAAIGENSYVSAVVKGADGSIKYYGKVANTSTKADGVVNLDISILSEGGDKLYLFSEQANGDKSTDYARELQEIKVPKELDTQHGNATFEAE